MKQNNLIHTLLSFFLISMLLICRPASSQTIETLFTTPEQRTYLDALRQEYLSRRTETSFDLNEAFYSFATIPEEKKEESSPGIIHFNLGAIITHTNGEKTLLLNNASLTENELPDNMRLIDSGNSLALQISTPQQEYLLKPGQSLNIETGVLVESSGE